VGRHPRRTSALWHDPAAHSRPDGVAGGAHAIQPAEAVAAAIVASQPPKPDAGPKRDAAKMSAKTDRFALVTHIVRLEEELANVKSVVLQMSARMLRLELAVSTLDKDGSLDAILIEKQR